jgi:hypothetical protein
MVLLNCEDPDEQNDLTRQWRDHKLNELAFIGIVVRTLLNQMKPSLLGS